MRYILLIVGILLLIAYYKKHGGFGSLETAIENQITTPENSTLPSLTGDGGGTVPNACACSRSGVGKVNVRQQPFATVSAPTPGPGSPTTINSIGQVVSTATGLPPNIFTGSY